jgi:hypothetical protein
LTKDPSFYVIHTNHSWSCYNGQYLIYRLAQNSVNRQLSTFLSVNWFWAILCKLKENSSVTGMPFRHLQIFLSVMINVCL